MKGSGDAGLQRHPFHLAGWLRLYARHYPVLGARRRPLVCLAGLTRNSRDFHDLAGALATPDADGRNVYALDYRGRGRSQHDPNWRNYSILIELNDVLDFMIVKGLQHAAVIGTSRGGILAMLMAVIRPASVGAVILNDIGPVIEPDGLDPDRSLRRPRAAARRLGGGNPHGARHQPAAISRGCRDPVGRDSRVSTSTTTTACLAPPTIPRSPRRWRRCRAIPELWPQFAALAKVPMLVLRGEHSDILSAATLAAMHQRHPRLEAVTVSGEGHAPLLKDTQTIRTIAAFLQRTDADADTRGCGLRQAGSRRTLQFRSDCGFGAHAARPPLHEAARRRTLGPVPGGRREPAETVLTALGFDEETRNTRLTPHRHP